MATVLNRTTGLTVPYKKDLRQSVNTPDYDPVDWIINPELDGVAGFDNIYWDFADENRSTVASLAIVAGGTGYAVLDVVTLSGGVGTPATAVVASVDGAGAITGLNLQQAGYYSTTPANPVALTGGTGTGATVDATYDVQAVTVPFVVDQATRDTRDAEIAAYQQGLQDQATKDQLDNTQILRAVVRLMVDELNILRAQHALADRTYAQARTAIFNLIDGGV